MCARLAATMFPFVAELARNSRLELERLVSSRAQARRTLLRRGDAVAGMYLIVGGSLRVYYLTTQGREATLYTVRAGEACILSLAATMGQEAYPAWVDAGPAGGEFVVVPAALANRLVDEERSFREFVFGTLSGRILDLMRSLEESGSEELLQRLARFLVRQRGPDGCVRLSQARIAAELGTAREVVYRSLRELAADGAIETARVCIRVVDDVRLALVADGARTAASRRGRSQR